MLGKFASLIGTKNVGVYRDDNLAVIHRANGPKMDRIRKDNIALFKSEELFISIAKKLDSNRLSRCLTQPRDEQVFSLEEAKQHLSLHAFWVKPSIFHHQTTAIDDQQTYFESIMQWKWIY